MDMLVQDGKLYIRKETLIPFDQPPHHIDTELPVPLRQLPDTRMRYPDEPLYILPHAAGLGDQLIISTLPEQYYRQFGTREIYIMTPAGAWRNNLTTPEFVWGRNPFVKAIIPADESKKLVLSGEVQPLNLRAVGVEDYHKQIIARRFKNNIRAIEAMHGLFPTSDLPRVYYMPVFREEYAGKVFVDSRSYSTPLPTAAFTEFVQHAGRLFGFNPTEALVLESKYSGPAGAGACPGNQKIQINTLEDYADLIYSSRFFLCADSGSAALASAVKGPQFYPEVLVLQANAVHADGQWVWANLQYHGTGKAHKFDFHS